MRWQAWPLSAWRPRPDPLAWGLVCSLLLHAFALAWVAPSLVRPARAMTPPLALRVVLLPAPAAPAVAASPAPSPSAPAAAPPPPVPVARPLPKPLPKPLPRQPARPAAPPPVAARPAVELEPAAPMQATLSPAAPAGPAAARVMPEAAAAGGPPAAASGGGLTAPVWRQVFDALLARHKQYPPQARRLRQQGTAQVSAAFSASGELHSADIAVSSGHDSLDQAALQLVRDAALAARQQAAPGRPLRLRIPVVYALFSAPVADSADSADNTAQVFQPRHFSGANP